MKNETYWSAEPDKNMSLWNKVDDRQKSKKVTPKEPRTWKQDMDNMRESMRESCNKKSCAYPQ